MRKLALFAIVAFLLLGTALARETSCGTVRLFQHAKETKSKPATKLMARATSTKEACTADDLYDSVYTRKTEHFQIFYTLEGPHQTTEEFIDSLAVDVESAWNFHTKKMGMLPPLGTNLAYHYQQKISDGLYPVEVLDIDLLRNTREILGGQCHGCYGLTIPSDDRFDQSELMIDNDFKFTPPRGAIKDTLIINEKKCPYSVSTEELENVHHQYSYAEHWETALRVTAIHELYHAVQLRYLDMYNYWTFWFEASASGIEEIAAPDVDDYYGYLPTMFNNMGTPLDQMQEDYGAGIFFMYLYNHVDQKADKFIWEEFSKRPSRSFQENLYLFADKKDLSADSLFQDFATRLSFAGKRSSSLDSTQWIVKDQASWPDFNYQKNTSSTATFTPQLEKFSYKFFSAGRPFLDQFKGKASLVLYANGKAEVKNMRNTNSVDSAFVKISKDPRVDSIAWIFSRFISNESLPTIITDSTLHAYPTPWRQGNLCFSLLPESKGFIEIRNRRGDLVSRERYEGRTLCLDEDRVKKLMVPGVYQFRAGSSGKTKKFLIVY